MEVELEKSKQSRREQTDEFEAQVKEIAAAHERELRKSHESLEEEKQKLIASGQQHRDHLTANHKQVGQAIVARSCINVW